MIYVLNDELSAQILTNMLDNVDDTIDQREGTPVYTVLAPTADELANLYAELKAQEDADFIVDAEGNITMFGLKLDLFAAAWGEERKAGEQATGEVTLFAETDTTVPAGTVVFAPATVNVLFQTNTEVTATPTGATVAITAISDGVQGNLSTGAITGVQGDLEGIITVTNTAETTGGIDEEDDDEFARRFLNNRRNEATSGNAAHYRQWATAVSGIEDAYVIPVWAGPNTVKVIVLSSDYNAPAPEKVTEVQTYIDSIKPIGATVTVEAATEIPINITTTVILTESAVIEDVQADYETAVGLYLQTLNFTEGDTVRIVRLQTALLDTDGILDITSFTVNGAGANVVIPPGSVAVKGSVTLNV